MTYKDYAFAFSINNKTTSRLRGRDFVIFFFW